MSPHLRSTIGTGSAVVSKVLLHVVVLLRNELLVIEIETSISKDATYWKKYVIQLSMCHVLYGSLWYKVH